MPEKLVEHLQVWLVPGVLVGVWVAESRLGRKGIRKKFFPPHPVAIYHPDRGDVLGDDVVQGGPVDWEQFTCGVELNECSVVIEQIVHDLGELIGKGRDILVGECQKFCV
jgi:hypothetical protein